MSAASRTDQEKASAARKGVADLEDILLDIRDFSDALRLCASSDEEMPPRVARLIARHMDTLGADAEKACRAVLDGLDLFVLTNAVDSDGGRS